MQKCSVCVRREADTSERERQREKESARERKRETPFLDLPVGEEEQAAVPSVADVTQIVQVPTQSHTNLWVADV